MFQKIVGFSVAGLALMAQTALAVPVLQLDSPQGTWVGIDPDAAINESTVIQANEFTLYAYGTPGGNVSQTELLSSEYMVSVAVTPIQDQFPVPDLGTFTVDGTTYDVTGDMVYGTPPVETLGGDQGSDPGDLSTHGVFDTYFLELSFMFDAAVSTDQFDVQTDGQVEPVDTDGGMFYVGFDFDVSGLDDGIDLHFDLYNVTQARRDPLDLDRDDFAPFSHDATTDRPPEVHVAEPGVLSLLGFGLLGLAGAIRRRRQ